MEANIIKQFMEKTGCDTKTAHLVLKLTNWDLSLALLKWSNSDKGELAANLNEAKKLSRGISEAADNEVLVYRARDALANDFDSERFNHLDEQYMNIPETNFFLPDFDEYDIDFQEFLVRDLIDKNVMRALEDSGKLNWWCNTIGFKNRLWSLLTSGDGNCLLHAASLSMFGFHDRLLTLRQALHNFLLNNSPVTESIKRRWRWHESKINLSLDVQHTEEEWEREWSDVVNSASSNKLTGESRGCYQGLEAIHVLCLAHVLRRVIIVIADTVARDSHDQPLSPIYFHGIYIPFAFDERSCWKSPLLLVYNNSHFSALVFMETKSTEQHLQSQFCIPITQFEGDYLPVRFLVDPGADFNWKDFTKANVYLEESKKKSALSIISSYLDVIDFYTSPLGQTVDSESKTQHHSNGDATNNNIPKQLHNFGKQFLFLTKLSSPKKEKATNPKVSFLCVRISIKKHAFQNEIIQNYIKFAKEKFDFSKSAQEYDSEQDNTVRGRFVDCVNKCGGFATENTSYLCAICFKQQKKQLQLLQNTTLCFAAGKSKFYREPDLASYTATKNLPKTTLTANNTLYLSNSTFFNDSNKPFSVHNNNDETHNIDVVAENPTVFEDISENDVIDDFCFGITPSEASETDNCDTETVNDNANSDTSIVSMVPIEEL